VSITENLTYGLSLISCETGQLHRMGIIPKVNRSASIPGAVTKPARGPSKTALLDALSGKEFSGKGKGRGWEDFRDRGDRMVEDDEDADKEDDDVSSRRKGKRELDEDTIEGGGRLVNGREGEELSEGVRKMKVCKQPKLCTRWRPMFKLVLWTICIFCSESHTFALKLKRTFTEDPDDIRKAMAPTPPTPKGSGGPTPSSNPFAPFAGGNKYTSPTSAYRRNGASASAPGLPSPLTAAAIAFSDGVLGSPTTIKFLGADAAIPGLGLGGALGDPLPGVSGIRGGNPAFNGASSESDDDTFSAKKRRWSKPIEEEIL